MSGGPCGPPRPRPRADHPAPVLGRTRGTPFPHRDPSSTQCSGGRQSGATPDAADPVGRASASSISCAPPQSRSATMSTAAQVGMPTALHDGNRDDDRNEQATEGGGRGVLRRSATGTRLGRRNRGTVELRTVREPAQRRRHDPQAQGVLCRGAGRSGRGPSRLRSLRGEAGPAGPAPARGRRRSTVWWR